MASARELRRLVDGLIAQLSAEIAGAYREAIEEIKSQVVLRIIVERLKAGDLNGVIEALYLDRAAFAPLETALYKAFETGGTLFARNMPTQRGAPRVVFRFDVRMPRAEDYLREHSSQLVTNIIEDQRVGIRSTLEAGLSAGKNPTATALEVVGRVNRVTGKRDGGILGLSSNQIETVKRLRQRLASGDPAELRAIIGVDADGKPTKEGGMKLRDKRFDKAVKQAAAAGKPLSAEAVEKMVTAYSNKALKYRGDLIGKEETFTAIATSKDESFRQAIESGKVSNVTKKWNHFINRHPRHNHMPMDGVEVPFDQMFLLPNGKLMRFPHDPKAGAEENLGCHCQADYKVNYFPGLT